MNILCEYLILGTTGSRGSVLKFHDGNFQTYTKVKYHNKLLCTHILVSVTVN